MKTLKNQVIEELKALYCLPLNPDIIGSVINIFSNWCVTNGKRWAVKRMKSLKVDFTRYINHEDPMSGIRRSKRNKTVPYGPFGILFRMPKRKWSPVLMLLNLYTRFELEVNESDYQDAESHIMCPCWTPDSKTKEVDNWMQVTALTLIGHQNKLKEVNPLLCIDHPHNKTSPKFPYTLKATVPKDNGQAIVYRGEQARRPKGNEDLENEILVYKLNKRFYLDISGIDKIFQNFEKGIAKMAISMAPLPKNHISGEVNFINEAGKLRYVACPYRYEQQLMKPLGDFIYSVLRRLPWDFTFDQTAAFPIIQERLQEGKMAYSFDLKRASDHIPLESQIDLLKSLIHPSDHAHINLWRVMSRGRWNWGDKPERSVYWTNGQPLGLYPSFGAFALWHGMLLRSLIKGVYDHQFLILGDDIVILDLDLAMKYESVLQTYHIPLSDDKTMSGPIAEFAGQLISKDGIIPSLKWDFSTKNIIWLGSHLGPRILRFLDPESRRLLKTFGDLLYPVGCEWFSKRPYTEKLFLTEKLLEKLDFLCYGNPEQSLRKNLSMITKDLLNMEEVKEILHNCIETVDKELGFSKSTISRDFPDFLVRTNRSKPSFYKKSVNFSEREWLKGLEETYKTLVVNRN